MLWRFSLKYAPHQASSLRTPIANCDQWFLWEKGEGYVVGVAASLLLEVDKEGNIYINIKKRKPGSRQEK
jgi:hypothetical protein